MNSTAPISTDPVPQELAAIILAAGAFSRMGGLKSLLRLAAEEDYL
jgi:CTP:molybdopterin cytidylyltransferase MocA